jgi:hypothetical protein
VRRVCRLVPAVAVALAAVTLYHRSIDLALVGDDYLLVQLANAATHRWALLLAPLDSFYRPTTTWTLILDRVVWGGSAASHHLGNLSLRALSAILLFALGRRLRLSTAFAATVALVWVCSPFSSEPVIVVGARIDELLWLSWLSLCLVWPGEGQPWSRRGVVAAATATVCAALSKETWVVTPALVLGLELGLRRRTMRDAVRPVAVFVALSVAYVAAYFVAFPTSKGYFDWSFAPLAKLPHQLAAFLSFEPLVPLQFPITWRGAVATAIVGVILAATLRQRAPAAALGCALLIAPTVPTLLVPYLPTRYTAIPYAGFLLVLAAACAGLLAQARPTLQRVLAGALAGLAVLVVAAGVVAVTAELDDAARVSAAYRTLLLETGRIVADVPVGRPIAVVRLESENPLRKIARSVRGLQKLYYPRHDGPYGLVDPAALLEWAIHRPDISVRDYPDGDSRFAATSGALLAHEVGRFIWLERDTPAIGEAAHRWRERGLHVRVVRVEQFP